MHRMNGVLKGLPIKFGKVDYNYIKDKDGYFIEINIKKINKKLHFPIISKVDDKNKIRNFDNNITGIIFVDKVSLEELIKYHDIEYEIIRGYYYNSGRNPTLKKVIKKLYNVRLEKKKLGNPIQEVYKLIMNSAYGKTIMKPIKTEKRIINSTEKMEKYVSINYNHIKYYTKIEGCDKWIIKKIKPIVDHYSSPQIGSEILSMSKRIMNEVICLAEELDCMIYYQDTDSMHIVEKDIKLLSKKFKEKYNRELEGKNLGQFHCDFDKKIKQLGLNEKGKYKKSETLPVAIESIFLGKKSYYDKLEMTYKGKKYYENHIRMKGIPKKSVIKKNKNILETYKKLKAGKPIDFDMLVQKDGIIFNYNNDYSVSSGSNYTRKVQFN